MADLLGVNDEDARGDLERADNGEILAETEALDCLAAIAPPPPKPRSRGEARRIASDNESAEVFIAPEMGNLMEEYIEEVNKRTKRGICEKIGHWHRECPEDTRNQEKPAAGSVATAALKDDKICSYLAAEGRMAARSNMVDDDRHRELWQARAGGCGRGLRLRHDGSGRAAEVGGALPGEARHRVADVPVPREVQDRE